MFLPPSLVKFVEQLPNAHVQISVPTLPYNPYLQNLIN